MVINERRDDLLDFYFSVIYAILPDGSIRRADRPLSGRVLERFFSDSTRFSVELVYQHCVAIREIVLTVEEGVEASMHQSICLKIYKSTYIQYLIKYQSKL